ncbi:MAG TPA: C4-type zinc ribbon domain-containing protein [Vicinamibacterales bacterium]
MVQALEALVALQALDTAADTARRRLAELPAAEQIIAQRVDDAAALVDAVKNRLQQNQQARRALDKDVAAVDVRLARFDDHKAAVKTNQEYTALLHEIATAKGEKDAIEDRILVLMEEADGLAAELNAAEAGLAQARRDAELERAALGTERTSLEQELSRLSVERTRQVRTASPAVFNKYDQILKSRRGLAVVQMIGETCAACHVRLRPQVAQVVRRNEDIVQCESCQRILYYMADQQQPSGTR